MTIKTDILHDFSKKKTYNDIEKEIVKKYKITNIRTDCYEDEALYIICDTLYIDYKYKLANYEAYIQKGMNARLLMELRNTMIQRLTDEEIHKFDNCTSPLEVVHIREKVMRRFTSPTDDVVEPWQLFLISIKSLGAYQIYNEEDIDFRIDFEDCYEDGDINKHLGFEELVKDFALNMRTKEGAIHKNFNHTY